ncbi:hypothetical protein RB195_024735 [Necator americanus]|uniref:Rab-GAP TBC domain-containing protein n=1 Tax=Necator americanus TaxID=51031 RepID=A0ABR1EPE4_NECAM
MPALAEASVMWSSEEDTRSMASQKSASSGSPKGHEPSLAEDDEEDLWGVWGEVIHKWEVEVKKNPSSIKTLVKRGIPQHFRTIAWQLLSNASVSSIHEVYSDYMRQSSIYEKVIQRDIPRTYPELEFFKDGGRGQASLFNVMKAYSIHDKEVGYCQGSAFIVGLLLLQMPEEEAFAVLVRLMENYRLRELYKPAMTDLGLCMFQLECLVQEQVFASFCSEEHLDCSLRLRERLERDLIEEDENTDLSIGPSRKYRPTPFPKPQRLRIAVKCVGEWQVGAGQEVPAKTG